MTGRAAGLLALLVASAASAQAPVALRYLGTANEHRRELADEERVLGSLFTSARIAYVIVDRRSPETMVYLAYPTGERSLRFRQGRAHFRLLIRAGRPITIRARRGNSLCFTQRITIRETGVWGLRLPC